MTCVLNVERMELLKLLELFSQILVFNMVLYTPHLVSNSVLRSGELTAAQRSYAAESATLLAILPMT